jgi:4-carboxymuconolactone decarboxylase
MAKVTAGRDQLGSFAPKFAELNDDVLFGEKCMNCKISRRTK